MIILAISNIVESSKILLFVVIFKIGIASFEFDDLVFVFVFPGVVIIDSKFSRTKVI